MARAFLYLRLVSLRNLVRQRVLRLRQPKYLLGALAAVAYFYVFVGRNLRNAAATIHTSGEVHALPNTLVLPIVCGFLALLGIVRITYAWISPPTSPALRFTEAEIAFLFPAPVSRRTLIHFRLLSSQFSILFTAVLMSFVMNSVTAGTGSRSLRAIGWWIILSTFDLHLNATNLTLARLKEAGSRFVVWRVAVVAGIVAYVLLTAALVVGALRSAPWGSLFSEAGHEAVSTALAAPVALQVLVFPFRILFGPYTAQSLGQFAAAIVPALGVLALHYYWVTGVETSFEEGSIALAERRAAQRAALADGKLPQLGSERRRELPGPFPLAPKGPPETAFLWKNLLSMRSGLFCRRALIVGASLLFALGSVLIPLASHRRDGEAIRAFVLLLCAMTAGYTIVIGPQLARQDLRSDLMNADLLKTYPIPAWRLALGEMLAPISILSAILWAALVVGAFALKVDSGGDGFQPAERAAAVACIASVVPLLCLTQLLIPNLLMVLMPGWYQVARSRSGGVDMFGQRLLFGIAQLLFAAIAILPSLGWAAVVYFCTTYLVGHLAALVLATLVAVFILGAEAAIGLWFLGERFERFDLSTEVR